MHDQLSEMWASSPSFYVVAPLHAAAVFLDHALHVSVSMDVSLPYTSDGLGMGFSDLADAFSARIHELRTFMHLRVEGRNGESAGFSTGHACRHKI